MTIPPLVWMLVFAVTACAHEPAPKAAAVQRKAAVQPAEHDAPIIALMDLTLTQEGRPIASLHADGRTEGTEPDASGKPAYFVPGPTLHGDGTIDLTKGQFTARVDRDGQVYVVAPASQGGRAQLFGRISGNALTLANSAQPWTVRVDGDSIRFNGPGLPNRIEGEVDDRVRHTALVMTAAFFINLAITSH